MERLIIILLFMVIGPGLSCNTKQTKEEGSTPIGEKTPDGGYSEGDSLEITGSLICSHCYALNKENTGLDHQLPESGYVENCASLCASQGYPVAVLMDEKKAGADVWVIRTSSQLFSDYMTNKTRIRGAFVTPGVIEPASIKVEEGDKWITIQ